MKRKVFRNCIPGLLAILVWSCSSGSADEDRATEVSLNDEFDVAAYVWPSTHDDPLGREFLWSEGIGEWEIIQKGVPRFKGHYQPRIPLWGYEMGDDPAAMEKKINAAADHGVNVFIFDWYWYDEGPFLESMVNSFVEAPNTDRMKFYIMWANHDVPGNMWNHFRYKTDSLIWDGEVDWENYRIVVDRIISQYFMRPNYYRIDGKPVLSIFSFIDLLNSFEGIEGTLEALDYLREKVKEAGFPGLHLQVVSRRPGDKADIHLGKYAEPMDVNELVAKMGINSMTTYTWKMIGISEDYIQWAQKALAHRNEWDALLEIPYFPCVSIGWDNTPRYPELGMESVVHIGNTPESFAAYLQEAKEFLRARPDQPKLIVVNAWNEYVEGSYLEPDMKWGYGYLEAVEKVMSGVYDKYSSAK